MNKRQLLQFGVPEDLVPIAISCIQRGARGKGDRKPKSILPTVIASPESYRDDEIYGPLADALIEYRERTENHQPIDYARWGDDLDAASIQQIENACSLPVARAAALMPDAHCGYGLPIGGVLACENAVIPYGVGVDIACRMKLSVTDLPVETVQKNDPQACRELDRALQRGTRFGTGAEWKQPHDHPVLDEDWSITAVTREVFDRAVRQLGTSGSGNHFVEWGLVTLHDDSLGIPPGKYVGLLSHSGSRGAGAKVCQRYTEIARRNAPASIRNHPQLRHLAWLDMDTEAGQEYWAAMNLMGRYASANHQVIHENVLGLAGAQALGGVENHHNFAWKETHGDRTWYVHRKGATPAGAGTLGVIPGNMADTAFIVRGKGNPQSLNSAAHGAGRRMSRTAAKRQFHWKEWREFLAQRNVRLLAGGLDEVPGAYKDIHEVMAAQRDLVDVVGEFEPRIVMMCGDGSRPED